jgi:outer membrane cobalamin receptor
MSHHILRACALGAALFCSTASVALAQTAPSPAPSGLPEIGHIVTSDRQDEPIGATARNTYVVTKADMVRHGYTTVADALAGLPGVTIERYGAGGAAAAVSIRGSASNGVLVLLDGRPVSGAQIGNVDLGALPTTGVERIEVVEGSGATLYGTGAEGGVVNIITARSRDAYRVPLVRLGTGSLGERSLAFENASFSFERRLATNAYDYSALGAAAAGSRSNADLASTSARYTTAGLLGALQLTGSAGITSRRLGIPGSTGFLTASARQDDENADARIGFALARGHATTTLDLAATRSTLTFRDPDPAEFGPTLDFSTEARLQASLRNVVGSDAGRLVYGVDVARGVARNDGGNGVFSATPFAQTAAYVQDSIRLGDGSRAYAGLRAERDGAAGAATTPSVGAVVALGAGRSLRVNAATAFRVPTAEDLTFPGFANPALLPERTRSFDATFTEPHVLGGARLGWFVQTGTDLIVLNPLVDFTLPFGPANEPLVNAQRASIAGFVFELSTVPSNGFVTRVNLTDTYRALAFDPGLDARRLPDRPVVALNAEVSYAGAPGRRVAALGLVAHVASRRTDPGGAADPYARIDAYARVRLAPQTLLSLRGSNLANAHYAELGGYPAPGRGFAVEVSTK